jgi:hypothetical protein
VSEVDADLVGKQLQARLQHLTTERGPKLITRFPSADREPGEIEEIGEVGRVLFENARLLQGGDASFTAYHDRGKAVVKIRVETSQMLRGSVTRREVPNVLAVSVVTLVRYHTTPSRNGRS